MERRTTLAVALLLMCVGLVLCASPTFAGTTRTTSTTFAFRASGFGTQVLGGQVPAGSGRTGHQGISCTNAAGRSQSNNVAEATLPGLGLASGIRTHVWTTFRSGVAASHSTQRIAEITLTQSGLASVSISAVTSRATAYHDSHGFHATTTTRIGGLAFTPAVGAAQEVPLPTPDHPVTIPGVATVYAGSSRTEHDATGAAADAYALRVDVLATGTSVRVAHSHAALSSGITGGIFGGHSAATRVVTAGRDLVRSGPNPLVAMPCQGTHGKVHEDSLASLDVGGQVLVEGAIAQESGVQGDHRAHGRSRAEVAQVSLGGGQVVIDGIVGKATVAREGSHVTRSAKGTRLASVTVAGQEQTFPKTGVLEVPGIVKLERAVVTRTHDGLSVIGLRITLLDGSGAVVNLAEAQLHIRPLDD